MGRSKKSTPTKNKQVDPPEKDEPETGDKEPTKESMLSPRELRRRHRESLRAKATGKIDMSTPSQQPSNKRILFDDDDDDDDDDKQLKETPGIEEKVSEKQQSEDSEHEKEVADEPKHGDEDEDDAIEEVQTSKARETEIQKRSEERDSARTSLQKQTKKRKRNKANKKKKEKEPEESTEEFDVAFFKQLDQEKQTAKEEQKKAKKLERQSQGKYTTFVVNKEEDLNILPSGTEGVEVAIISQDTQLPLPKSNEEEEYARDCLENGSDGLSGKQIRKAKKRRNEAVETPSWHRSTKMSRLVAPGQRRRSRGMPASLFKKK